jgi:hypothetical protein
MREIHRRIAQGDPAAALALEVFCHRLLLLPMRQRQKLQ